MATRAPDGNLALALAHWARASVRSSDLRLAATLIAATLAYGGTMYRLSGVGIAEFRPVLHIFVSEALAGAAALLALYVALCIASPGHREGVGNRLFWLATAAALAALTFPFYGLFKQLLLPERGYLWDPLLARAGPALLGVRAWQLTHHFFGSLAATLFLDALYSLWMVVVFLFPLAAGLFVRDQRLRFTMLSSWSAAWLVIGTIAAWCLASAGPCYYNSLVGPDANYAELGRHLAALQAAAVAKGYSIQTIQFQGVLLNAHRAHAFVAGGGISAAPSMHVALATLCAVAGFRFGRPIGVFLSVYALLIWIASIHFGWHYFIDGPIAAVLMLAIWQSAERITNGLLPQEG